VTQLRLNDWIYIHDERCVNKGLYTERLRLTAPSNRDPDDIDHLAIPTESVHAGRSHGQYVPHVVLGRLDQALKIVAPNVIRGFTER
jgi:hypothetical protein